MSDLVNFMALWENTTKAGKTYVSGYLGDANIVGFKNEDKRTEKEPDWKFYISKGKRQKQYEESRTSVPAGNNGGSAEPAVSDQVPF